jgi:hypothetical protein
VEFISTFFATDLHSNEGPQSDSHRNRHVSLHELASLRAVPWLRRLVAGLSARRPGFDPGSAMWDLWWTKWHWDMGFPQYFSVPLSISIRRCSINRKNEKSLIIIITGLHNKPQGCGASVASAAGPSKKKTYNQNFPDLLYRPHQHNFILIYSLHVFSVDIHWTYHPIRLDCVNIH